MQRCELLPPRHLYLRVRFVGKDCGDFAVGKTDLSKGHVLAEIVEEKLKLRSMFKLFPLAVITVFSLYSLQSVCPFRTLQAASVEMLIGVDSISFF